MVKAGKLFSSISSMRTKLLGLPTSIALDTVATALYISYFSVAKYLVTTSLALHAAIKCPKGKPLAFAIIPAQILPKLPLGTTISIAG